MLEKQNNIRGFTLLELIVTVAVAAVLVSLTAPAVGQFVSRAQRDKDVNELFTELVLARTEAVRRSQTVGICASADHEACGDDWNLGWVVFVDIDEDGVLDEDDEIIRLSQKAQPSLTISADTTLVRFASRGSTSDTGGIKFVSNSSASEPRMIQINTVGQPRICPPTEGEMTCDPG